jgi:CheY-like chemotaxis protein
MNETPTTSPSSSPETTPLKIKVMFVDDDRFLLDMYTLKFNKAGYDVKTADSTDAALRLLSSGYAPDVMLADIVMPDMDGLQFDNHHVDQPRLIRRHCTSQKARCEWIYCQSNHYPF